MHPTDWLVRGSGPPMVWLHGFLGCAADMRPLIDGLAGLRRGISFDLPGHGQSPRPVEPFEQTIDTLLAGLRREGVEQFDLAGYSMGGRLACGLLARAPRRVRSLALIAADPGLPQAQRASRALQDTRVASRLRQQPLHTFLETWYAQTLFGDLTATPGYQALLGRRAAGRPADLADALEQLGPANQPDYWPVLRETPAALLFVCGERDRKYARIGSRLAAIPAVTTRCVPGAAHAVHLERPDAVIDALTAWLCPG